MKLVMLFPTHDERLCQRRARRALNLHLWSCRRRPYLQRNAPYAAYLRLFPRHVLLVWDMYAGFDRLNRAIKYTVKRDREAQRDFR